MMMRKLLALMVLVAVAIVPRLLPAHGAKIPRAADAPPGLYNTSYAGSVEFAEALRRPGAIAFAPDEMAQLESAHRHFQFERELLASGAGESDAADAAFNRAMGERALLQLLEGLEGVQSLDFRAGSPPLPGAPARLRARDGAMILRVVTGDGDPAFTTHRQDFEAWPEPQTFFTVDLPPSGSTWVLLEMTGVPVGKSFFHVAFRPAGESEPRYFTSLAVERPRGGVARVEVLDEAGQPTPALLRIVDKADGRLVAPPNAIDMRPQFEAISGTELGGPPRAYPWFEGFGQIGWHWLVPGPFEIELPPGEHEVVVERGPEHERLRETFTVAEGEVVSVPLRPRRWVDMGERGWWSGDDHVHARILDDADASRVITFARATNLNVANVLEMGNGMRTWYEQRGFGPAFRVQQGNHALVPGQEDPRYRMGHAIGLNLTSLARDLDKYMLNDWVAEEIHRQGGLYGHTHVGWQAFNIERDMTLLMPRGLSDFGSILQGRLGTELYYDFLDLGFPLAASAGSDTPYGNAVGSFRVYAHTGRPFDVDEWFGALRAGRTFVTFGPMVEFTVDGAMPGERLAFDREHTLVARVRAEGIPGSTAPARVRLVRLGEVIAEATSDDPSRGVLELEHEFPVGHGGWVAVHVNAHDGTAAHTTPVYTERAGFRPWNAARAAQLLDARFATLDEIDAMLAEVEEKWKAGEIWPHDFWSRWAVEQAPQVRQRTALAREQYGALRELLAEELPRRAATP